LKSIHVAFLGSRCLLHWYTCHMLFTTGLDYEATDIFLYITLQ